MLRVKITNAPLSSAGLAWSILSAQAIAQTVLPLKDGDGSVGPEDVVNFGN